MSISQPISTLTINNEEIVLAKSPYIGNDGFWYVFDEGTQEYKRSSSKAAITGNPGPQGKGIKSDVPVEFITDSLENYGKLRFTLYDPAKPSETISVMTNNSVKGEQGYQGISITNIEEITEGEHSGELKITTTDPASGSDEDFYYTGRIAAGFGTLTATVDNNVGTPGVSVSASGPDMAKNFSFEFHNLKGVQGYQGNMITGIDVSSNHIVFTLTDPATSSSSTIRTSGEVAPITVNNLSPSDGNISITGSNIPVSINDSTTLANHVLNSVKSVNGMKGNVVIPNATASTAGLVRIGSGISLNSGTISVPIDNSLISSSPNPVRNSVICNMRDNLFLNISNVDAKVDNCVSQLGNVGTVEGTYVAVGQSIDNDTWTTVLSPTLPAGTYVIIGNLQWKYSGYYSRMTGTRQCCLSTSSGNDTTGRVTYNYPTSGTQYSSDVEQLSTWIFTLPTEQKIYFNAHHTQGSAITVEARLKAVRIA